MTRPDFLQPFVLDIEPVEPERHGNLDLYLPVFGEGSAAARRPAIVFVHGGPVNEDLRPTPRDWPVYRGYGSTVARRGLVGVTVDHRLYGPDAYATAADDIVRAVEVVRSHPRVDADRVALWFFSGGGLLIADWLVRPPTWLRCVAATYPLLAPLWPDIDARFSPIAAVSAADGAASPPIVLTTVGLERPQLAGAVESFIAAARAGGARLEVIDVPNGRHGFDMLDHTDESRRAVEEAVDRVLGYLR